MDKVYNVLIIDDSAVDRATYRRYLKRDPQYCYHVAEAGSGMAALGLCQATAPDIVLLDFVLPDLDGLEVLEQLKQQNHQNQIACVMLTGQGDERIAVAAMKNGAQDYLVKGELTAEILCRTLHNIVERTQLLQELEHQKEQQRLVSAITLHIRQSLDLPIILDTAVAEIRNFLQADRVLIYQFTANQEGGIIAESVLPEWGSCPQDWFDAEQSDLSDLSDLTAAYRDGKRQVIGNIYQAGLSDHQIQQLEQFHIKSNLVVPILLCSVPTAEQPCAPVSTPDACAYPHVWGLLVAHQCSAFRTWQASELQLLEQLAIQLALAIQQAELYQTLHLSNQRLALALEAGRLGTWEWNIVTGEMILSSQCESLFGLVPNCFAGTYAALIGLLHPDDREPLQRSLQTAMQLFASWEMDYRVICPNGSIRWISSTGKLIFDEVDGPIRMVGVARDITERKRSEHELQQAKETLEQRVVERTALVWKINQNLQDELLKREQAEQALRNSEERLHLALEASGDGLWDWNIATGEIYYSPRYMEMLGYAADELPHTYETWEQLVHPEDRVWVRQRLDAHLEDSAVPYAFDYRLHTKSGQWKWIAGYGKVVLRDQGGKALRITGTHRDIDDRKSVEQTLQEKEQFLRSIYDGVAQSIFVVDVLDQKFRYVGLNPMHERLTGIRSTALQGKMLEQVFVPEVAEEVRRSYQACVNSGETITYEECLPFQGQQTWWLTSLTPLQDSHSRIYRLVGTSVNITDRKASEEALQQSESILRSFFNSGSMLMGVIELRDDDIMHLSDNRNAARFFGMSQEAMRNQLASQIGMPKPILNQWIEHCRKSEQLRVPIRFEYPHYTMRGQRWLAVSVCLIASLSGEYPQFSYIVEDITSRKRAELELQNAKEAAEVANKAKSVFLANMSHELRTPLNVILGFAQVMNRDPALTPEQQENLRTIHRSGDYLLHLINEILDLSKIEAGRVIIDESSFDLHALLHTLGEMFQQPAAVKGLTLTLALDADLPQFITADANKLRQVLLNLLSNAIKFTERGSITLRARTERLVRSRGTAPKMPRLPQDALLDLPPDPETEPRNDQQTADPTPLQCLILEVEDTGIGIASEDLPRIFKAFVQTQAGRTATEGTGLGLTISRKFIQLMQGELSVRSVPEQGSTFTITLPVRIAKASEVEPLQGPQRVIGLVPGQPVYRVLVVDDQRENRQLMVLLLSQIGLEVQAAANGAEAVQRWQQWQPHLIWMDMRMPVMDGYEATQRIRATAGQSLIPIIIALTAQAAQSDCALALSAGCNDFMSKPFREEELFTKMKTHLGMKYIYADDAMTAASRKTHAEQAMAATLSTSSLQVMPKPWIQSLQNAALHCDDEAILDLIQRIPPEHAALSTGLSRLAHDYEFDVIIHLTQLNASSTAAL